MDYTRNLGQSAGRQVRVPGGGQARGGAASRKTPSVGTASKVFPLAAGMRSLPLAGRLWRRFSVGPRASVERS